MGYGNQCHGPPRPAITMDRFGAHQALMNEIQQRFSKLTGADPKFPALFARQKDNSVVAQELHVETN